MEKNVYTPIVIAILIMMTGCSHEALIQEQDVNKQVAGRVITLTGNMPNETAKTRMIFDRDGLDIKLTWEKGDALELCVIYKDGEVDKVKKQVVTLEETDISGDGKKASFQVHLPEGDYTTFDLYGVYGGGGLDEDDPTQAYLPEISFVSGTLEDLRTSKAVMLTFAKTGIDIEGENLSMDLQHVGALFCVQLHNEITGPVPNIKGVELSATTDLGAYNNTGTRKLDLTNGNISGSSRTSKMAFDLPEAVSIPGGGMQEFWGWFVPVAGEGWPAMSLNVTDGSGAVLIGTGSNTTDERESAIDPGHAFYFSVSFDGATLAFDEIVKDIDGNIYTTVKIGSQVWMVENLKVTRYRNGDPIERVTITPEWGGVTGKYGVYQNDDAIAAFAGNLYNWYALTDPRGIAPEGWRVPTEADWNALVAYLGGEDVAGGKLKSTDPAHWNSPNTGATNSSGFTAVGGGIAHVNTTGSDFGNLGFYWCSTQHDPTLGLIRMLGHDHEKAIYSGAAKAEAFSVRLIKGDGEDHPIELSVSPSNTGTVTGAATYKKDNWVTITASPETGFAFDYWQVAGSGEVFSTKSTHSFQVTRDLSLIAVFKNAGSVEDIDGNAYTTVEVGSQTWMVENLKVTHYRNGDPIERVTESIDWDTSTGKYGVYQNDDDVAAITGNLYNWAAVTDSRNIAPEGWRVPTEADWNALVAYLGGEDVAGGKLKSTNPAHWNSPNTGATNSSGFTAVAGGQAEPGTLGVNFGVQGIYWCSTEHDPATGLIRILRLDHEKAIYSGALKTAAFSVRLIKDE
jgi:uncharacterized protein (TIGR02145 family)